MPIDLIRTQAPIRKHAGISGVSPLTTLAGILLVILHLIVGAAVDQGHARPFTGAAVEDPACSAQDDAPDRALPFD